MKFVVAIVALSLSLAAPAKAQFACSGPACPAPQGNGQPLQPNIPAGQQIGVTTLPAPIIMQSPVAPAPASFSVGSLGGELLGWIAAVFAPVLAGFATKWLVALSKRAGIDASAAMSDKLDLIIQNGIMAGAHKVGADMKGRLNVDVRNEIVAKAVTYAQAHGADTIKDLANSKSSLGFLKAFDPTDPKVIEALQARAAKVLNDVSAPDAVTKPPATTQDAPVTPPGGPAAAPQDPPVATAAAPAAAAPPA